MRQVRIRQAEREAKYSHTLLSKGQLKKALEDQGFDMGFYEVEEEEEEVPEEVADEEEIQ